MLSRDATPQDVATLHERMKTFYRAAHIKMETAQALYDHSFPDLAKLVPTGTFVHNPSTASSIIDHFRDNIRVQTIVPLRDDWGISKKARGEKALLLRLDSFIVDKFRADALVDPFTQVVFDMSLRGAAAWKVFYDPTRWPEEPSDASDEERKVWKEVRGQSFPLRLLPRDPGTVMPAPGGEFPIPWVIEEQTRSAWEVERLGWSNPKHRGANDEVTWVEYWSAESYKVVVDGEFVIDEDNPYRVVPYVFEYSGMGRVDARGSPEALAVNLLEHAESELRAEALLRTVMDAIWQKTAFPHLLTTENPTALKARWDLSSGGILQVPSMRAEDRPQWLEQPQLDQAMFQFLPLVMRSIERATFSSVMEGSRQPGVDYGYLQALLVGQASLRKDNIIGMASRLFARGVGLAERVMSHLDLFPVLLGPGTTGEASRRIDKGVVANRFDLQVRIDATDPTERDRKMLAWLSPLRAGAIPLRDYLTEIGYKDPDETMATIYAERVIQQVIESGLVMQNIMQSVTQSQQTATMEEAAKQQFAGAQQGVETPPNTPPVQESPVAPNPLDVVKRIESVNQRAVSFNRNVQ